VKIIRKKSHSFPSELGDFAPWREEFPTPSAFSFQIRRAPLNDLNAYLNRPSDGFPIQLQTGITATLLQEMKSLEIKYCRFGALREASV
jgi:hypothetical protein